MNPWNFDDISNGFNNPPQMYLSERIMFSQHEYDIKKNPGKHFGLLWKIDPQFMHLVAYKIFLQIRHLYECTIKKLTVVTYF